METEELKTLESLQLLCSKKECCSRELMQKALRRLDGDEDAARRVVESLKSEGFCNDARYAGAFAREKSALTGWGPVKIKQALAAKGIPRDIAQAALEEIDEERSSERLTKLLAARWRALEGDPYARFKLLKYALSRGYEYEQVRERIEKLIKS